MNTLKDKLKQFKLLYALNARVKCFQMKYGIASLTRRYDKRYRDAAILYDERSVITLFQEQHHQLQPKFSSKQPGELKVFWVGASEAQDESGFLQALNRLGQVTKFWNRDGGYGPLYEIQGLNWLQVREINDATLIKQVIGTHQQEGIDILIGQMWSHIYSEDVLLKVRALGIPVINIAMDDRLPSLWSSKIGQRMGTVGLGSGVDITLTTSPETCKWYATENMSAIFWPLASDEKLFAEKIDSDKDIDILFIGNRYGIRGKLVEYLFKHGISVTCYGSGWSNGYVNAQQNIALSKRAKIILGVGAVGHCSDIYTLKLRDFDALMTGALYITHRNPDLLELFKEGEHLECYTSPKELLVKLNYYLKHPEKCSKIGRKGRVLVENKHSWDYRLNTTFSQLGLLSESPPCN
ncbi:MAG: glycosyltransferase family 1 protein [Gammaproteobacteria bacterium]|nr:glycosyltransferase family 1 protein [Gammaproteobacteria bacterium]